MRWNDPNFSTLVWERIAEMLGTSPNSAAAAATATLARVLGCNARSARATLTRLPLRCGSRWRRSGRSSCWPHPMQIGEALPAKVDGQQLWLLERPPLLPGKLAAAAAGTCMIRNLAPSLQAWRTI